MALKGFDVQSIGKSSEFHPPKDFQVIALTIQHDDGTHVGIVTSQRRATFPPASAAVATKRISEKDSINNSVLTLYGSSTKSTFSLTSINTFEFSLGPPMDGLFLTLDKQSHLLLTFPETDALVLCPVINQTQKRQRQQQQPAQYQLYSLRTHQHHSAQSAWPTAVVPTMLCILSEPSVMTQQCSNPSLQSDCRIAIGTGFGDVLVYRLSLQHGLEPEQCISPSRLPSPSSSNLHGTPIGSLHSFAVNAESFVSILPMGFGSLTLWHLSTNHRRDDSQYDTINTALHSCSKNLLQRKGSHLLVSSGSRIKHLRMTSRVPLISPLTCLEDDNTKQRLYTLCPTVSAESLTDTKESSSVIDQDALTLLAHHVKKGNPLSPFTQIITAMDAVTFPVLYYPSSLPQQNQARQFLLAEGKQLQQTGLASRFMTESTIQSPYRFGEITLESIGANVTLVAFGECDGSVKLSIALDVSASIDQLTVVESVENNDTHITGHRLQQRRRKLQPRSWHTPRNHKAGALTEACLTSAIRQIHLSVLSVRRVGNRQLKVDIRLTWHSVKGTELKTKCLRIILAGMSL